MADNETRNNIDEIVSGVQRTLSSGVSNDGMRMEFFEETDPAVNAVFETDDTKPEEAPVTAENNGGSEASAEQTESASATTANEEKPGEDVSASGIWTTYVPRFTDASLNYRMRGQSTPRSTVSAAAENPEVSEIEMSDSASAQETDPTAESDSEAMISGATVVNSNSAQSDSSSDAFSRVFKFDPPEVDAAETAAATAEEPSEQSVPSDAQNAPEPQPIEEVRDNSSQTTAAVVEEVADSENAVEQGSYVMPDPIRPSEAEDSLPVERTSEAVVTVENVSESIGKKKRKEYTALNDRDGFIDRFVDSITSVKVRLIAALVLFAAVLVLENLSLFGVDLVKLFRFDGISGAYAIIDAPFVVALFLLALPEVLRSYKLLVNGKVVPELALTVSLAVISVYYVVLVLSDRTDAQFLFGFVYAVSVVSSIIGTYYKEKADFLAFKTASSAGEKTVVDRKLTRNLHDEHHALDGKIESYKSRTARFFETGFVSDFFARTGRVSENSKGNLIIILVSLLLSLVGGTVAFFAADGIVSATLTLATVFLLSVPAMTMLTHKIPYYHAESEVHRESCALVGEQSFFDYSSVDVIAFEDTDIFGKEDVNLQRIMVYGRKENLPKALHQMSALFTVVGGPLAHIFADAVDRRVSPADNVTVENGGVKGTIDGIEIIAGTEQFMKSNGLTIPSDPANDTAVLTTTRIMYAAESGEIYAKFYVRYMLSEEFTMLLPLLTDENVHPLVYTRDPNVNNDLFRSLTAGTDSIRVLKKLNLPSSEKRRYSKVSLGLVSEGDKQNVINALLVTKKYSRFRSKAALSELIAMIVGAVAAFSMVICRFSVLPSVALGAWHTLWCAGLAIFSSRKLRTNKEN